MAQTSPESWQSMPCLEANAQNKKWFPCFGNQSNLISDQHIHTHRQRGEECPIDWYCLPGRPRGSPEEKTSVAGGPHSPPNRLPSLCLLSFIYVSILLKKGGTEEGCMCVLSRCCRETPSHAVGVCVCVCVCVCGFGAVVWLGGWKDGAVTCQTAGMLMPWLW